MIAPFDVLTGNLSGRQDLVYGQNDSKAYEAENGKQGAKNYKPRFIGAKRADGKSYFSVRMKSTTVLTSSTRRTMAVVGVTAAIRSALVRNHPTLWGTINDAYAYLKAGGRLPEGQDTFGKWFAANIKDMLLYHRATWSFTYVPLAFTIHNPYNLGDSEALVIKLSTWIKFANWFSFDSVASGGVFYTIDAVKFFANNNADGISAFDELIPGAINPNYRAMNTDLSIAEGNLMYKGEQVYTSAGVKVSDSDSTTAGQKFTTAEPQA